MTYDIHCRKCGRYLGACTHDADVTLKCPNCRSLLEYHIMLLWDSMNNKPPKDVHDNITTTE